MAKPVESKVKTLYILNELMEKSDVNNRLSTTALQKAVEAYGKSIDRKSIYDDIETLREAGFAIEYSKEKPSGYYYDGRPFELPELKLLVDAVQSSKFITAKKTRELINKIESLSSRAEAKALDRHVYILNRVKTVNENIYYNVDKIHEAILADVKVKFNYYRWTIDKELVARHGGEPFYISPWALTWDDENYYMIGYDDTDSCVKHYRVDKMKQIDITRRKRSGKEEFENFDIATFATRTFGMFGGKQELVTLECSDSLIGVILDRFGTDVIIAKSAGEEQNPGTFQVRHEVTVSGQFFGWLFGLGSGIKIVSPEHIKREFQERLKKMLETVED